MVLLLVLMLILRNETRLGLLSLGRYDAPEGLIIERGLLQHDGVLTLSVIVVQGRELLFSKAQKVLPRAVLLIVHLHG